MDLWYDGESGSKQGGRSMKKPAKIIFGVLAAALAVTFFILALPEIFAPPEPPRESADIPAFSAGDLLACRSYLGKSADALHFPEEVRGAQRLYSIVALEGTLFGVPAYGTVYFSKSDGSGEALANAVYLHTQALSYKACFAALCETCGEPYAQGEESYTGPAEGTALWSKFHADGCIIELTGTTRARDVDLAFRLTETY